MIEFLFLLKKILYMIKFFFQQKSIEFLLKKFIIYLITPPQ